MATSIGGDHVSRTNRSAMQPITVTWTSTSGGTYSETIAIPAPGELVSVKFVPGSPAPTDLYDVTITDAYGIDVLSGQGANLSTSTASEVCPGIPVKDGTTTSVGPRPVWGNLTLSISNAGASKAGTIVLVVR